MAATKRWLLSRLCGDNGRFTGRRQEEQTPDNVLNDVMFGVLSGLLKAKEHMRIESSEVATVELKPYKSETETCVITLNNGEQVVLKLPDSEGNTRSIQIALNRNF